MDAEQLLIERVRKGDQQAFTQLVQAYQTPVYNLAYRMLGSPTEAEEAAQETFLRVYMRLSTYDAEMKFSSWILAIASHYCIDRLRRRRLSWLALDDLPEASLPDANAEAPEREALSREKEQEMQSLLALLPEAYRLVIVLRYWHDLSYEEMAGMLGASESAIKSRLHRAREMLEGYLAKRQEAAASRRNALRRGSLEHALP